MNPATALATVLVDELIRGGVREAVLSPGSWSTPLALAFSERAEIRLHVRIDERSAGFCALGLAKVSKRPVPVLCTSGTATANLHPAVIEADHAGVPLLVLTADRPPEMHGVGASQTINQHTLYGDSVRVFVDVAAPEARIGNIVYWRSLACRAIARMVDPFTPGPAHLNIAFRRPLTPTNIERPPLVPDTRFGTERRPLVPDENMAWPESLDGRPGGEPWTEVVAHQPTTVDIPVSSRGLLVAGDGTYDIDSALTFAHAAGWPIIAEPSSNLRRGKNALVCGATLVTTPEFIERYRPDMVVTLGRPTVWPERPAVSAFFEQVRRHIVVDPRTQWSDVSLRATQVIPALGKPINAAPDESWLSAWQGADSAARNSVDAACEASGELNELRLARDLAAHIPSGSLLYVGPSMPIRDLDTTLRPRDDIAIFTNRGASGMDGMVSSAVGGALAHQAGKDAHVYALLGDLTFLHDQNGLIIGPYEPRPDLTIVVASNNGGGLFSFLPQAGTPNFERIYGTPHNVDFSATARSYGIAYERINDVDHFIERMKNPSKGMQIIEVSSDRVYNKDLHSTVDAATKEAIIKFMKTV